MYREGVIDEYITIIKAEFRREDHVLFCKDGIRGLDCANDLNQLQNICI